MPVGRKIYYDKDTGDEVLTIPEKHHEGAIDTTKEQDFQVYSVLQNRDPDQINQLKIAYGDMRGDFERAKSWKVNPEKKDVIFDFPAYEPSHGQQIRDLKADNEKKTKQLEEKDKQIANLGMDLTKEKKNVGTLQFQNAQVLMRLARNNIQ